MTTYVAPKASSGVQPRLHLHEDTIYSEFDIAAAVGTAAAGGGGAGGTGFALNDIVQMVKTCPGMRVTDVRVGIDDMDTSTGFVFSVGDGDDTDRFILVNTSGQAGGVARMDNPVGVGYQYTTEDTIDLKVTTAATGTAATTGKIRMIVSVSPQQ
jgi:hypothetical protein